MKVVFLGVFALLTFAVQAQLSDEQLKNLVKLGELYARDQNYSKDDFGDRAEALRMDKLDHIVDVFKILSAKDTGIFSKTVMARPSDEELKYWYVIRDIHHNVSADEDDIRSNMDIAKESLEKEKDSRVLLKNYYDHLSGGIAFLFNDADLRRHNLDLDNYGFTDDTEKAICYFSIMSPLTVRFRVLNMMQNSKGLLEFAAKMPKVNDRSYYKYTQFDFDDFDADYTDGESMSYREREIGKFYGALMSHFIALMNEDEMDQARVVYRESILTKPDYFKYSADKKTLKKLYKDSK